MLLRHWAPGNEGPGGGDTEVMLPVTAAAGARVLLATRRSGDQQTAGAGGTDLGVRAGQAAGVCGTECLRSHTLLPGKASPGSGKNGPKIVKGTIPPVLTGLGAVATLTSLVKAFMTYGTLGRFCTSSCLSAKGKRALTGHCPGPA